MKNPKRTSNAAGAVDDLFAALASESRRRVLEYFETDGRTTATLTELTNHLAAREGDAGRSRERIRLRLHHTDLPKLDESGLMTYDAAQATVQVRHRADDERMQEALSAFEGGSN